MAKILDITPDEYHRHEGFSSSVAKTVIADSVLHAKESYSKEPTKLMDRGSAIHTFLLGKGARLACLPFDDWRTKAAKESREATRAAGMVPLLHGDYTDYETAAAEIRKRLEDAGHFLSDATGTSECAVEWDESTPHGPLNCKAMMDHARLDTGEIFELKVVDSAHPDACERTAENLGYGISAAAYVRALLAARPDLAGKISFRFLFCEAERPFAIYTPRPTPVFMESGERRWLSAVEKWAKAKATGRWPSFEDVDYISRPRWALSKEGYRPDEW